MIITNYWEGDVPLRPMYFGLQDEYGNDIGGAGSYAIKVRMLDTDNREVDLRGSQLLTSLNSAYATFIFPTDRTLFPKHGDYLVQLSVEANGRKQWTSPHTIRVNRLGKRGKY